MGYFISGLLLGLVKYVCNCYGMTGQYKNIGNQWNLSNTENILEMGTSMSYSSKQKCRIEFRNRAIPRSKIPHHLEKYYRYKQELVKNKDNPKLKNESNSDKSKLSHINSLQQRKEMIEEDLMNMPNDIPSIEDHSEIVTYKHADKSQMDERSNSQSNSNSYVDQDHAQTQKEFFPVKMQQKASDVQTQPLPKIKNLIPQAKEENTSQSPGPSQNIKELKIISQKGSSSNKRSNGRPESESSHALSEIILQREAYYTINYENFREDIKQEGEECSMDVKDRRLSEKISRQDNLKFRYSEKDHVKNEFPSNKVEVMVGNQPLPSRKSKQLAFSQQPILVKSKRDKKDPEIQMSQTEKTVKTKPFNIILQINSNIDQPLFSTSLKPTTPVNISSLSKNVYTNYSNNNSDNLSTNSRARKLIYF